MATRKSTKTKSAPPATGFEQGAAQDSQTLLHNSNEPLPAAPDEVVMHHADGRSTEVHRNSIDTMKGHGWALKKKG